jgi:hypothetical protein
MVSSRLVSQVKFYILFKLILYVAYNDTNDTKLLLQFTYFDYDFQRTGQNRSPISLKRFNK